MLPRFDIIVAVDKKNGIGKNGKIPWKNSEDMKFFKETTIGKGNNVLIMGKNTYLSVPKLEKRDIVVLSKSGLITNVVPVFNSFLEALKYLGKMNYDKIFICGGENVYKTALTDFSYLCDKIYLTRIQGSNVSKSEIQSVTGGYQCDTFFPFEKIVDFQKKNIRDNIWKYYCNKVHDEYQYLNILKNILLNGENKPDRTGIGTKSIFGCRMEFDISQKVPILTTKKVFYNTVIKELLFFISGKTDTSGIKIWEGNTSKTFLEKLNLDYREGDMGPMYPHCWRHWNAEYKGCDADYTGQGIDQLAILIDNIKKDPYSRRHILSAWNVEQLNQMVLAPCHVLCQFNVSDCYLDCQLYQRSGDMFLGIPFNIASYSILTYMIAKITGLKPRKFIHIIGDAHIYNNHIEQVQKQLERVPFPFPTLSLKDDMNHDIREKQIDEFVFEDFLINDYNCWPGIKADMAV